VNEQTNLTNLTIEIDNELRQEAESLFFALGMTFSTAVNIFIRQAVQEKAIPFSVRLNERQQFHMLLDNMRATATSQGFMTDEEINAEITAARRESA
jgi:DNA-damage-inducible protein J